MRHRFERATQGLYSFTHNQKGSDRQGSEFRKSKSKIPLERSVNNKTQERRDDLATGASDTAAYKAAVIVHLVQVSSVVAASAGASHQV